MLRILAILSDLLLLAALFTITRRVGKGVSVSISSHAATNKWTYWTFALALTVCGSILSLYLLFDIGSKFHMDPVFSTAAIVGWASLLATAWVAETPKKKRFKNPHWVAANLLSAMMGLMLVCITFTSIFNPGTRIIAIIFASWYFYSLYLVIFNNKAKLLNFYQLIQYSNIISFTTLVLAVSYIR